MNTQDMLDLAALLITQAVDEANDEKFLTRQERAIYSQALSTAVIAQELKRANDLKEEFDATAPGTLPDFSKWQKIPD